jgi:hypothetical protein
MSETSILPPSAADPGIDMVPPGTGSEESESSGDRRRLVILGIVAGVIVLLAAAYMLLHKGSSSAPVLTSPPHAAGATGPGAAGTGGSGSGATGSTKGGSGSKASGPTTLPKVAKQPKVRDPFLPLVTAPVDTSGGATSTTTVGAPTPGPSTGSGTTPITTPTSPPVTPPTTTKKGSGGKTTGSPLWIQLMKTHANSATFDVGYAHQTFRRYKVAAPASGSEQGTVFDKEFALIGVQNGQATVQVGDATPFDLTKGVAHVV